MLSILRLLLQEHDHVVMVQEYADGGDLFNLLQKYGGRLSERVTVQMVLEPFLRVLQVRRKADKSGLVLPSYTITAYITPKTSMLSALHLTGISRGAASRESL